MASLLFITLYHIWPAHIHAGPSLQVEEMVQDKSYSGPADTGGGENDKTSYHKAYNNSINHGCILSQNFIFVAGALNLECHILPAFWFLRRAALHQIKPYFCQSFVAESTILAEYFIHFFATDAVRHSTENFI